MKTKKLFKLSILFYFFLVLGAYNSTKAQSTYYTSSKSCGSCGGSVSVNSTIGMRCPHCGVRWGYENKNYSKEERKVYTYSNNYSNQKYVPNLSNGDIVFPKSNINVRSGPGTNYAITNRLESFNTVTIISRSGDWYYVSFTTFNSYNYQLETHYGYVAGWLLNSIN